MYKVLKIEDMFVFKNKDQITRYNVFSLVKKYVIMSGFS